MKEQVLKEVNVSVPYHDEPEAIALLGRAMGASAERLLALAAKGGVVGYAFVVLTTEGCAECGELCAEHPLDFLVTRDCRSLTKTNAEVLATVAQTYALMAAPAKDSVEGTA